MKKYSYLIVSLFIFFSGMTNAQSWQWAKKAGGIESDYANGMDVDNFGNTYVAGTFYDAASFDSITLVHSGAWSVYLAKYDPNGGLVWARIAAWDSAISVSGVSLDFMGNISIVGQYFGSATFGTSLPTTLVSAGSFDVFVAKYTGTGDLIWAESLGDTGIDYAGGISNDKNGNVYVTGDFHISAFPYSSSKIFVAKYNSNGNISWLKTEMNNGISHFGNSIKSDSLGNSYICGDFFGTIKFSPSDSIDAGNIESNSFNAKFDSAGNFLWGQKAGSAAGYCVCKAIDIDAAGNSYVTGYYHGSISLGSFSISGSSGMASEVYVAKCDAGGNYIWVNKSLGAGNSSSISVDNSGNVFVFGFFTVSIQFGLSSLVSAGNYDIFITELNQAGDFTWATSIGGLQSDLVQGAAKSYSDAIYLAGTFAGNIDFGTSFTLVDTSIVKSDIFIAKLNTLTGIEESNGDEKINIYPNPSQGDFEIVLSTDKAELTVTDLLGHQISKTQLVQTRTPLHIDRKGEYILNIKTKRGTVSRKLMLVR